MRWTRQRQRAIVVAGRSFGFVSDRLARRRTMLSRTAKSCGPDAPTLASSFAEARDGPTGPDSPPIRKATVAKEPGHRGEHEISRQNHCSGKAGVNRETCDAYPCAFNLCTWAGGAIV